jgi:hypothetical protein
MLTLIEELVPSQMLEAGNGSTPWVPPAQDYDFADQSDIASEYALRWTSVDLVPSTAEVNATENSTESPVASNALDELRRLGLLSKHPATDHRPQEPEDPSSVALQRVQRFVHCQSLGASCLFQPHKLATAYWALYHWTCAGTALGCKFVLLAWLHSIWSLRTVHWIV